MFSNGGPFGGRFFFARDWLFFCVVRPSKGDRLDRSSWDKLEVESVMKKMCLLVMLFAVLSCGDDEVEADKLGVAAACATAEDCKVEGQTCLTQFKGGYCGIGDCVDSGDCPTGSSCVAHTDNKNYCFRDCVDKIDCNANRPADSEANCSSSITYASGDKEGKACVPPSN
jgi:hypothetical protein